MRIRFHSVTPVLALFVSGLALGQDWTAYTSDNFTLYSDTRESDAVEMLENFELFRRATLALLNLPDTPESERLVIVVYDRGRDYGLIRPETGVSGFFYHSVFGPRMIVGPGGGRDETQITLFHEYVHYLMNLHASINFPRWYSEGFATMLSSADITEESIVIGTAPPNYLRAVSLSFDASVHDVIDMKFDGASYEFYVTSWLLTHYLLLDAENAPVRRESTLDYFRRYDAGEDSIEAFRASFGIEPAEMQRELEFYGRRRVLTAITMPRASNTGNLTQQVLTDSEALYRLGDIAVERDKFEAAHEYFDRFEDQEGDSALRDNVDSRRAIVYIHERRIDEGDALIERLHASNPTDVDVLADIAHYAFDRFVHEVTEPGDQGDAESALMQLERSIDYGVQAAEANPSDVEALFYLGLAYEAGGQLQLAADTLFRSHDINPSAARLNMALVRVLIQGQQPGAASYLLSRLYSASHSEQARAGILELQQQIRDETVDVTQLGLVQLPR